MVNWGSTEKWVDGKRISPVCRYGAQVLDLSANRLRSIQPRVFNLPNLDELGLESNQIAVIEPGAFDNARVLQAVGLTDNSALRYAKLYPSTTRAVSL